ncbi:unnamed protein product, partial [Effrenium voratum]
SRLQRPSSAPRVNRKLLAMARFVALVLLSYAEAHCLFSNKEKLMSCAPGCLSAGGDMAGCISGCMQSGAPAVSATCSNCLGEGFTCAYDNCAGECYPGRPDFYSANCIGCIQGNRCKTCATAAKGAVSANLTEEIWALAAALNFTRPEAEQAEPAEPVLKSGGCYEDQGKLKTCGTQCFSRPNRQQCAAKCLRSHGMSSGCANCFGHKVDCTIKNCLSKCMSNSQSAACKMCVHASCGHCTQAKSSSAVIAAAVEASASAAESNEILP